MPRQHPWQQRPSLWIWALWFAIVTGLGQAFVVLCARVATHALVMFGRDFVWMSIVANAIVFGTAALILTVVTRGRPPQVRVRLALAVFLFLSLMGPLLLVPRLHRVAALLLSTGISLQGARLLLRHPNFLGRVVRGTLAPLITIGVVASLIAHFSHSLSADGGHTPAPRATSTPPNVVLIVLDTVRAQNLSLYGYGRQTTPHLDRFARGGIVFERAFSASPWTLPSHAAMFTGQAPHALSADWLSPLDSTYPTLAEVFRRNGYRTAGFVGNVLYCTTATGLARGFERFKDYPVTIGTFVASSWLARPIVDMVRKTDDAINPLIDKRAAEVNAEFDAWLGASADRPFFAFLNYFDAHAPYQAPPPYTTAFGDGGKQADLMVRRTWSRQEIQRSMDAYDGELRYVDEELQRLLETLRTRRLLENTLVVITSDHGEQFGEHGLFDHANSLYRQVLHVPLVVAFPGRLPAGMRVETPVSLADLPATVLDIARIGGEEFQLPGRSLAELWSHPGSPEGPATALLAEVSKGINMPSWLPASKGAMQSVIVGGVHYIRHSDGTEELYDFEHDVDEVHDLAGRSDAHAALEQSRRALEGLLRNRR